MGEVSPVGEVVEEAVEEAVEETVEEAVEEAVEENVEEAVEEAVTREAVEVVGITAVELKVAHVPVTRHCPMEPYAVNPVGRLSNGQPRDPPVTQSTYLPRMGIWNEMDTYPVVKRGIL